MTRGRTHARHLAEIGRMKVLRIRSEGKGCKPPFMKGLNPYPPRLWQNRKAAGERPDRSSVRRSSRKIH